MQSVRPVPARRHRRRLRRQRADDRRPAPRGFSYVWDDGSCVRSGGDAFDGDWGLAAGLRHGLGPTASPHRLVQGADLLANDARSPDTIRLATLARVMVGYGYGRVPQRTALTGLGAAWGPATWRSAGLDMSESLLEVTAEISLRWQPGSQRSVGASAGWLHGRDRFSDNGATLTMRRAGLTRGLNPGWTWDARPHALE